MKRAVFFFVGIVVLIAGLFVALNLIDENDRVSIPTEPPAQDRSRQGYIALLGIAAPLDSDWQAEGARNFQKLQAGTHLDQQPFTDVQNKLGTSKITDGKFHGKDDLLAHEPEVSQLVSSAKPYLERFARVVDYGDAHADISRQVGIHLPPPLFILKLFRVQQLVWNQEIARGESRVATDQARKLWDFEVAMLSHDQPLIQIMIDLAILSSIKRQMRAMVQAGAAKLVPPVDFRADLDPNALFEHARLSEIRWIRYLLDAPSSDSGDLGQGIMLYVERQNRNRIVNALNEIWLSAAAKTEPSSPVSWIYPVASSTTRLLGSHLLDSRLKMDTEVKFLAAPL